MPTDEERDSPNEGWAFSMFEGEVAEAADGERSEYEYEWKKLGWWARNKRHMRFSMTEMLRSTLTLRRKQVWQWQEILSSFGRNFSIRCMIMLNEIPF